VATNLYGVAAWGVFAGAQATILLLARVCLLGLDKGVLWWIPHQSPERARSGLAAALVVLAAGSGAVSALLVMFAAPALARALDQPESQPALQIMGGALVPFRLVEPLVHTTMGKRRMEAQVFVREALVPSLIVGFAATIYLL